MINLGKCKFGSSCSFSHDTANSNSQRSGISPNKNSLDSGFCKPITTKILNTNVKKIDDDNGWEFNENVNEDGVYFYGAPGTFSFESDKKESKLSYAKVIGESDVDTISLPVNIAISADKKKMCSFFLSGTCKYGDICKYSHEIDGLELNSAPKDECGICYSIPEDGMYGLLNGCDCIFCVKCIRNWRKEGIEVAHDNQQGEMKQKALDNYRYALKQIPCKYFDKVCPFGLSCFYKHLLPDGTEASEEYQRVIFNSNKKAVKLNSFFDMFDDNWMSDYGYHDSDSDSADTEYSGDISKQPLILIHGFGASVYHWRYNIPELAKNYHVFALDLLGFGLSDKPIIDYDAEIWRDQVLAFIEEVVFKVRNDKSPCVVAGNSLGGFTALYAASYDNSNSSNHINGCILINAAGRFRAVSPPKDNEEENSIVKWIVSSIQRLVINISFIYTKQPARIEQILRQVYPVNSNQVDTELVESIQYPSLHPNAAEVFYRVISKNGNGPPVYIDDLLPQLKVPLLLLWGVEDPWIRPRSADLIQQLYKSAIRVDLDAGHCPHDEAPERDVTAALNVHKSWIILWTHGKASKSISKEIETAIIEWIYEIFAEDIRYTSSLETVPPIINLVAIYKIENYRSKESNKESNMVSTVAADSNDNKKQKNDDSLIPLEEKILRDIIRRLMENLKISQVKLAKDLEGLGVINSTTHRLSNWIRCKITVPSSMNDQYVKAGWEWLEEKREYLTEAEANIVDSYQYWIKNDKLTANFDMLLDCIGRYQTSTRLNNPIKSSKVEIQIAPTTEKPTTEIKSSHIATNKSAKQVTLKPVEYSLKTIGDLLNAVNGEISRRKLTAAVVLKEASKDTEEDLISLNNFIDTGTVKNTDQGRDLCRKLVKWIAKSSLESSYKCRNCGKLRDSFSTYDSMSNTSDYHSENINSTNTVIKQENNDNAMEIDSESDKNNRNSSEVHDLTIDNGEPVKEAPNSPEITYKKEDHSKENGRPKKRLKRSKESELISDYDENDLSNNDTNMDVDDDSLKESKRKSKSMMELPKFTCDNVIKATTHRWRVAYVCARSPDTKTGIYLVKWVRNDNKGGKLQWVDISRCRVYLSKSELNNEKLFMEQIRQAQSMAKKLKNKDNNADSNDDNNNNSSDNDMDSVASALDMSDSYIGKQSLQAALCTAAIACRAVDIVMENINTNVFACTRPPGHHAGRYGCTKSCVSTGFCLLNNAAIALTYARVVWGLNRVAVVDFDVHYGNGTADILKNDPNAFFASLHMVYGINNDESIDKSQDCCGFYPSHLGKTEISDKFICIAIQPNKLTGKPKKKLNETIYNKSDDLYYGFKGYRKALDNIVIPKLIQFNPELLIISAGFDGFTSDPIGGGMKLTIEDYEWTTKQLLDAMESIQGKSNAKVISLLEGGYDTSSETLGLAQCVDAHVAELRKLNN
eukprot:gene17103-22617_t